MLTYEKKTVPEIVRNMEDEDRQGNTKISKYVNYSQRETINKIDAYINSQHISGKTDSLGREKPFFNIVTASKNIWYRATDIDRKNITVSATKMEHYALSFVAAVLLTKWMRTSKFGQWLNEWGRKLATYGSCVSEFVEKDGELVCDTIPWARMICDPIDFDNNPKIKILWLTPAQLRENKNYDQDQVEYLITSSTESRETVEGDKKDNKANYIQLYEVYGEFPLSFITDEEADEDTYVDQLHVISYVTSESKKRDYDDYTLYRGRKKNPLRIDHLIKEDGRTISIGSVEHLFEAQWMVNHSQKAIKDHLDVTSKYITQTSDGSFVNQNILNSIENGQILIHKPQQPLTRVANSPDISALQAFSGQWRQVANEITNISESMMGQNPPSGQAWRLTESLLQESHSLFELMIENKGLAVEEIIQEFVLPHLKKKMDTSDEISEILESHNIKKLDNIYVPKEAIKAVNKRITNDILKKTPQDLETGNLFTPEMQEEQIAGEQDAIQKSLNQMGNQRFIKPSDVPDKTWKKTLEGFEWDIHVDVTGESKDKQAILTTLTNVLQTISANPAVLQDERAKQIFGKILETTGAMSAIEVESTELAPQLAPEPMPPQPMPQQV